MKQNHARSAGGAFGLDRQYVTCQQIFQQETERIFDRHWICIDHVSRLDLNGVRPLRIGENRLLVLGDGARFRVYRNVCRHRGSLLVTESNCESIGQRIQCPYHAWTYDRQGCLIAAPNMQGVENFDTKDFGLMEVPCETFGGFLWVKLNDDNSDQSVEEFLFPVHDQFVDYQIDKLVAAEQLEYEVAANWKLIFQNFSECYHCPSVHPALNRLTPFKDSSNVVEAGPILGGPMQLAEDCDSMSIDGKKIGPLFPKLTPAQTRSINYFTIFPTIFLSTHPDYVLVHRLERTAVNRTQVICQFLVQPESTRHAEFDLERAVKFWDLTNRQDWEVCQLAQSGMQEPGYQPGPYSDLESVVAAFDQHYVSMLKMN